VEMRKFSRYLSIRTNELNTKIKSLEAKLAGLSEKWKDPVSDSFRKGFQESMISLKQFINISTVTSQHLIKKAELLEKYLDTYR